MKLNEQALSVSDQRSFLAFVRALVADREDEVTKKLTTSPSDLETNGWENGTIEAFLGAAASWAEASEFGKKQGLFEENPWRQFAVFLYCGKIYE